MRQIGIAVVILCVLVLALFFGGLIFNIMLICMKIALGLGVIGIGYLFYLVNKINEK